MPGEQRGPDSDTLSVRGEDESHTLVQRFWLLVVAGPDSGATFTSNGERTVIGTYDAADLVLHDTTVSRFHCEITPVQGRVLLRDLGSLNGTSVNGVGVLAAVLHSGATITMGRTQVRFDVGAEHINIPVSQRSRFGVMVGKSLALRRAFALLERAAATDSTLLLEGETGTGKEVAAESVHRESARAKGPFVVVDCSAIPGDLLESELFGHEKGSFTGAVAAREGAFEAAHGGSIFLDEIGELPLELQPKMLRVLERKEVKRVGSSRYNPVDVRVIAATNRNLRAEVNAKKFRSDLYYRLAVLECRLPPLRERLDDLPLLVDHIVDNLRLGDNPEAKNVKSKEFLAHLEGHSWPGNVRELRNYLERCIALHERAPLAADGAGPEGDGDGPSIDATQPLKSARDGWIRSYERRYAEGLLARHGNNVTAAARAAGVDRIHFYRLLWRHGLR
jgi:two-component system, NtrC family, response regulator GlrR